MRNTAIALVLLGVALAALASEALAGGGPETTLVVVNADSPSSLRVANAYARLRDIPASHVLYLEGVPAEPVIRVDQFRGKILAPIETYLAEQGLTEDIDTIAYSTAFPYGVDFDEDTKAAGLKVQQPISRIASLTGLTYLYRHVGARDPVSYLGMTANRYYRGGMQTDPTAGSRISREEALLMQAARGAMKSKSYRRAAETYQKLADEYPDRLEHRYNLACALALNGKDEEALDALATAVEKGFTDAAHAAADRDLETLRKHSRFREILEAMGAKARAEGGDEGGKTVTSRAFRADAAWTEEGEPDAKADPDDAHRYRLAAMLGWTGAYGNSTDEVIRCLERAAGADATSPEGTVYFMVNQDVRAKARMPLFPAAVDALKRLGRKAEILEKGKAGQDGRLPQKRDDVFGLLAGTARFAWGAQMPDLVPGAIAEHLTSFGAHFGTAGQTKCTEFIRHGAAGTSGTVAEPYAVPMKFPSPFVHVHYARGCSLAEAFYQTVWGPYQLLVIGDPLTRPFARFSEVRFASPTPTEPWAGQVEIRVDVEAPPGHATAEIQLWVDGVKIAGGAPMTSLAWDTTKFRDGVHDVRVVAVDAGPIATRSYAKASVRVTNGSDRVALEGPSKPVPLYESIRLRGRAGDESEVQIRQGSRVVARAESTRGRSFEVEVPGTKLGAGRTTLQAMTTGREGAPGTLSEPVPVEVTLPTALGTPLLFDERRARPGVRARWTDPAGTWHEGILSSLGRGPGRMLRHDWKALGNPPLESLEVRGAFRVPAGVHEITVRAPGPVRLVVGGRTLVDVKEPTSSGRRFVTVGLAEGWHALEIDAQGKGARDLAVTIGGVGPSRPLAGALLAHLPPDRVPARAPKGVAPAGDEGAVEALTDGKYGGAGTPVNVDGLVVSWKRTERNVRAVVLYAARGKDAKDFPLAWTVDTRSSARGKWRPVKNARVVVCPGPEAPRKGREPPARYVEILFDKTSAREIRARPVADDATAHVTEVEIDVRG